MQIPTARSRVRYTKRATHYLCLFLFVIASLAALRQATLQICSSSGSLEGHRAVKVPTSPRVSKLVGVVHNETTDTAATDSTAKKTVPSLRCTNCFPGLVVFTLVREDLLELFLASVDVITEHVFVVCNFESVASQSKLLRVIGKYEGCLTENSAACANPNLRTVHILSTAENVGFAGSFNLALKAVLQHSLPYVIINSDDIRFKPGRLLAAKHILDTEDACMFFFEGFGSFGITRTGAIMLGPMDENFWPAYAEDCDYWFRAQLKGCRLYYRGKYSPERSTEANDAAFVVHGDLKQEHVSRSVTYKSSSLIHKLVANTLDGERGRFAYLVRKWGFNVCDFYHEVINAWRTSDEILDAVHQFGGDKRHARSFKPYGNFTDVNFWLQDDWRKPGAISSRAVNSHWAPKQLVWQESDYAYISESEKIKSGHQADIPHSMKREDHAHEGGLPQDTGKLISIFHEQEERLLKIHSGGINPGNVALIPSSLEIVPVAEGSPHHIPAIVLPVLSETSLLQRCIRSVDVPVQKIILIMNSLPDADGKRVLSELEVEVAALVRDMHDFLVVIRTGENFGYGRSMNLGMKLSPWASWWLCSSVDVSFPATSLSSVMRAIANELDSGVMLYMLGVHFASLVLTKNLVRRVGYFDENIWPAYVEDCDLMLRVRIAAGNLNADIEHFDSVNWEESGSYKLLQPIPGLLHVGQQGSSNTLHRKISKAHENNINYYLAKWGISRAHWHKGRGPFSHGCGIPMKEQFRTPFNHDGDGNWEHLPIVRDHVVAQRAIFRFD